MITRIIYRLMDQLRLVRFRCLTGGSVGHGSRFRGQPLIILFPGTRIRIGSHVSLINRCSETALGIAHPVVLPTLQTDAVWTIGDNIGISGRSFCAALSVTIGSSYLIVADILNINTDTDFHTLSSASRRYESRANYNSHKSVGIGNNLFANSLNMIIKRTTFEHRHFFASDFDNLKHAPTGAFVTSDPYRVVRELLIYKP